MKWFKTTEELRSLAPKLAEARMALGLSQEEAGAHIGTHQTVISKIDGGKFPDTFGEVLAKALVEYALLLNMKVPEMVESDRARVVVKRTRASRDRRFSPVPARVPNEAAQLGVLNLVAAGSLKPQEALALLKSL